MVHNPRRRGRTGRKRRNIFRKLGANKENIGNDRNIRGIKWGWIGDPTKWSHRRITAMEEEKLEEKEKLGISQIYPSKDYPDCTKSTKKRGGNPLQIWYKKIF